MMDPVFQIELTILRMMEELQKNSQCLDLETYKVMLIWDPVSCQDVGWITILKEAAVDKNMSFLSI